MTYLRRTRQRHHKLCRLLLPAILLVPLGGLKWRADWIQDHPSLSRLDKRFRAVISQANSVSISGGGPTWDQVTRLSNRKQLVVLDRKLLTQLTTAFRMSDEPWTPVTWNNSHGNPDPHDNIAIAIWNPRTARKERYFYVRNSEGGDNLVLCHDDAGDQHGLVKMPTRFCLRFETLIGQLAQRAQTPGHHAEIVVENGS